MYSVDRIGAELVPILVKVQLLQSRFLEDSAAFASSWNWVDAYLRLEHTAAPTIYTMLRQVRHGSWRLPSSAGLG